MVLQRVAYGKGLILTGIAVPIFKEHRTVFNIIYIMRSMVED